MPDLLMIYGANGYTGRLIVAEAVACGLTPVLSGRNATELNELGQQYGLEVRVADLSDATALDQALDGIDAVIHAAGPFSATYRAMTAACLRAGVHYLDITGEPDVLAGCMELDRAAKAAGIVIMPAVGFDVVPTDCAAAMAAARLADATRLTLAFGGFSQASRGTARTMFNHIDKPVFVRRDGAIKPRRGDMSCRIDFGDGPVEAVALTWGDIITAAHTTGIQNIEVFVQASPQLKMLLRLPEFVRRFLASPLGRPLVALQLRMMPAGPDAGALENDRASIFSRATNDRGQTAEVRLSTPQGYALTAKTAVRAAETVLAGKVAPGYHSPAGALGADFILGIAGVMVKD